MTELKAEALAARLTRIREPLEAQMPVNTQSEWLFHAVLKSDVSLEIQGTGDFFLSFYSADAVEWELGGLRASINGVIAFHPLYERDKELAMSFATRWLPFFRRGCWLSGCPIDTTAHEKAEWLQGFTREELEAWNLKM